MKSSEFDRDELEPQRTQASSQDSEPEPPRKYAFSNWGGFVRDALRYHRQRYPNKTQVVDRMNTLRQFMPAEAITYLGGLMRPHPRYGTDEGWDDWVANTADVLQGHDHEEGPSTVTPGDLMASFKRGVLDKRELWDQLDLLVLAKRISSDEQRALFWKALGADDQASMESKCEYFNPEHEVWEKKQLDEAVAEQKASQQVLAEQTLAKTMELLRIERAERQAQTTYLVCVIALAAGTIIATGLTVGAVMNGASSAYVPLAVVAWNVLVPAGVWFSVSSRNRKRYHY